MTTKSDCMTYTIHKNGHINKEIINSRKILNFRDYTSVFEIKFKMETVNHRYTKTFNQLEKF